MSYKTKWTVRIQVKHNRKTGKNKILGANRAIKNILRDENCCILSLFLEGQKKSFMF